MIDPIPPIPAPDPLLIHKAQFEPIHQMHQQRPDDQIGHILPHTLPRAEAKPPIIIARLRRLALEEALGAILADVSAPVGVPRVERVRVDDEIGAGGEGVVGDGARGGRGLGHGESGEGSETGGFGDAGREQGGGGEEVGAEVVGAVGGTVGGEFCAERGLGRGVGGQEDEVPADAAEGDVEVGVEHLVEGVVELFVGDGAGGGGGKHLHDGRVGVEGDGALVGEFIKGVPFGAEVGERTVGFGREVFGPFEAGEAALDDVFEESFALGG